MDYVHEYNPAAVTPMKNVGRPVKELPLHEVECRVTPPDGKRPEFNIDLFTKFVAFEEGGEGTNKQLHYHILLETTVSDYRLAQYWNEMFPAGKGTGNKLFRNGKPHDKTAPYIAKHKTPVVVKGYTETDLQTWYVQSDEYVAALKKERDRYRRIKSKGRKAELKSVEDEVYQCITQQYNDQVENIYIARAIVKQFLHICTERLYEFPSRNQMDGVVYRIMYKLRPSYTIAMYCRNYNIE